VPGQPAASIDRGNPGHTLNFLVPGTFTRDALAVRARVWGEIAGVGRLGSDWLEETYSFTESRPLRLHLYGIHYLGKGLDIPAPSIAEVLATLTFVRRTYPVPAVEVASFDTIDFSGDLTDSTGPGCGRGWNTLLLLLHRLRAASASADPHYALLPGGVPSHLARGYGTSLGVGASYVGSGSAMAQELGHIVGLRHAPGCGAADTDPRYPSYPGHPEGSIGEYGFDCVSGEVHSPATSHDFMGYCGNYWVSPHTYRALLSYFGSPPGNEGDPAPAAKSSGVEPRLYLGFGVRADHHVELFSGVTLSGPPLRPDGKETPYRLELWDESDRVLSSEKVHLRAARVPGDGEAEFLESVSIQSGARKLAFRCCERHEPAVFEIPEEDLQVEIVSPDQAIAGKALAGPIELRWKTTCASRERLVFYLRYSSDGGLSWRPVNIGLEWTSSRVDLERLAGGEDCRLQVVATTMLQTATAQTAPFRVKRRPRLAVIAGSTSPPPVHTGPLLELIGAAHSPEGFAGEEELVWSSNRQGELGKGSYLIAHDLMAGEHVITLAAPDGVGGETRASTVIRVAEREAGVELETDLKEGTGG
jgi:hypothetical protein